MTEANFISGAAQVPYAIFFENLETATAPAQEVVITDPLDANLDLESFSFGPISFGDRLVVPEPGLSEFTTDVDLRQDLLVRINARLDKTTGLLTWRFTSLDPVTQEPPADPVAGFLPPNVNPPEGDGAVMFTVNYKSGLSTDTRICNQADIVFDFNAAILTPEWCNTLDNTKPSSQVLPLAATQTSADFLVQWSGADTGSGIQDYSIFVSKDSGPFAPFVSFTQETSATFTGQPGSKYAFYSVARDKTLDVEDPPASFDTMTAVNQPPVASCKDVTVNTDQGTCSVASAASASVDNGSSDPEGGAVTVSQSPAGPYSLGANTVTLTVSDSEGATSQCTATVTVVDPDAPTIMENVSGTLGQNGNGWYVGDVNVSWQVADQCPITQQQGCDLTAIATDTAGQTLTCEATSAGGTTSKSATVKRDTTAPSINGSPAPAANAQGWNNTDVAVSFACSDSGSGIASCGPDQTLTAEGANQSALGTAIDNAGLSAATTVTGIDIDKTPPSVAVTGVTNGAVYPQGSVPVAGCTTTDAVSGVATQASLSLTGGDASGLGTFTASCTGALDNASNPGSASVSYQVVPPPPPTVDACTPTTVLDNFDRADGSVGSNWRGATGTSFYRIAGNRLDVQAGGPIYWNPAAFGMSQADFVTLSTVDPKSPSQGLLLKVQSASVLNAGAIAVVYDAVAKAVRVSTLRLGALAWTSYGNTPVVFDNGDKLGACAKENGEVRVYKNDALVKTATLGVADQRFFNPKGGMVGVWSVGAPQAFWDDFGGATIAP